MPEFYCTRLNYYIAITRSHTGNSTWNRHSKRVDRQGLHLPCEKQKGWVDPLFLPLFTGQDTRPGVCLSGKPPHARQSAERR